VWGQSGRKLKVFREAIKPLNFVTECYVYL